MERWRDDPRKPQTLPGQHIAHPESDLRIQTQVCPPRRFGLSSLYTGLFSKLWPLGLSTDTWELWLHCTASGHVHPGFQGDGTHHTARVVRCCSPVLPLPPAYYAKAPWQQGSLTTVIPEGWTHRSALTPTTRTYLAKAWPPSPQRKATELRTGRNLTLPTSLRSLSAPGSHDGLSGGVMLGFLAMPTQYIVLMETSQIHFMKSQRICTWEFNNRTQNSGKEIIRLSIQSGVKIVINIDPSL